VIRGLFKIIAVALAFLLTHLANLSFNTEYYYAISSMAYCSIALFSISFAMLTRSNSLLVYATIYVIASIMYALLYIPSAATGVDYFFYQSKVNFSMIISISDLSIIVIGGFNVIYRIYTLIRGNSSSDSFFDARMGLR
jgi:hypothetical protein